MAKKVHSHWGETIQAGEDSKTMFLRPLLCLLTGKAINN
jgi:hypothetical protein